MKQKPMLAYPVSDKPIDYSKKVFMQPKLDGVRCVIQAESDFPGQPSLASFTVKAYSRTGKEWKNIQHILDELKPFFQKFPNVILDGELYNHDLRDDFETIISLVRRQTPDDIDMLESADLVQFHCYDIIAEHFAFEDRNLFIEDEITCHVPLLKSVRGVKTREVFSDDDAIEHTLSQPNTDAYANPAVAPIVVNIIVNFILKYINVKCNQTKENL